MATIVKGRYIGGAYSTGVRVKDKSPQLPRVEEMASHCGEIRQDDLSLSDLSLASTLIRDAIHGRHCDFNMDAESVRSYHCYNNRFCTWTTYLAVFATLALAVWEKPAVFEIPLWVTVGVESLCLIVFIARHLHRSSFENDFWKNKKNLTLTVILTLTWLDIIAYLLMTNMAPRYAIRLSRPLRIFFLILFTNGRQLQAFRNIRLTLVDIANVLCLLAFCIFVFALFAYKLFGKRQLKYYDGSGYFDDFMRSLWDLFVLVTTANFPDVMLPAYNKNNVFALFFVVYIVVNNYLFMSILLAVIYNNYRRHLKEEVRHYVYHKRRLLGRAFDIMKVWRRDRYVIVKHDWHVLLKVLMPDYSPNHVTVLMLVLDENDDGCIERREFLNVADLLSVRLTEVKNRLGCLEKAAPKMHYSCFADGLRFLILTRYFSYFFDVCIIANVVCIGLERYEMEWAFLGIFLAEICLKIFALGVRGFFKCSWNIFDFFIITGAFVAAIVVFFMNVENENLEILLILRLLRLVKLLGSIPRFRVVITTISSIVPSLLTHTSILFMFYYVYAIIGTELFHGLVHYYEQPVNTTEELFCGNRLLNGSAFHAAHYCGNNFNDMARAFVVLFELMYVNQWNVITEGFVLVTNSWARIYFVSFHLCCVLLILNIFVAFILEAFILEYTIEAGRIESWVERKIKEMGLSDVNNCQIVCKNHKSTGLVHHEDPENVKEVSFISNSSSENSTTANLPECVDQEGICFHLEKKGKKSFLVLLQAMFENEMENDGLGAENFELMGH